MRIQCTERIPADAILILEQQAQFRLKREIWADEDAPKRIGIVPVKRIAILAVVACFQAYVVRTWCVAGQRVSDCAFTLPAGSNTAFFCAFQQRLQTSDAAAAIGLR